MVLTNSPARYIEEVHMTLSEFSVAFDQPKIDTEVQCLVVRA